MHDDELPGDHLVQSALLQLLLPFHEAADEQDSAEIEQVEDSDSDAPAAQHPLVQGLQLLGLLHGDLRHGIALELIIVFHAVAAVTL